MGFIYGEISRRRKITFSMKYLIGIICICLVGCDFPCAHCDEPKAIPFTEAEKLPYVAAKTVADTTFWYRSDGITDTMVVSSPKLYYNLKCFYTSVNDKGQSATAIVMPNAFRSTSLYEANEMAKLQARHSYCNK
jgi:hypothetical protein